MNKRRLCVSPQTPYLASNPTIKIFKNINVCYWRWLKSINKIIYHTEYAIRNQKKKSSYRQSRSCKAYNYFYHSRHRNCSC